MKTVEPASVWEIVFRIHAKTMEDACNALETAQKEPDEQWVNVLPIERITAVVYRLRAIITAAEQAKERLREIQYTKMEDER